ncbi:superoxide dismutase [Thermosynechococcaceae cyanobacterium BACA0444]|uniref:Superoxide dismutase n=1 Tax=Pseudocalidococcus azoricus BACA0444 TaxID=2918990 RepID=A0AAE4JVL3_9CYAN|nr:superoxide dismutase [Pseudocalidococcus azoricus]MDS3859183.1 superoxide dismutase [Pseudocalidococcus azoricus BACA0444]
MTDKPCSRRQALVWCGTALFSWALFPSKTLAASSPTGVYVLPPLPYAYNALEPYIDAETMQFHHDKHHAAYVNNLNAALQKYPQWSGLRIEELLEKLDQLPNDIRQTVRNNGGGHANHSLFWESMGPAAGGEPTGNLATAIQARFGSFGDFQAQFNSAGLKQFGSGWVWLGLGQDGTLQVFTTPNQDSPLSQGITPLLGNDVWEHAYYLSYRNRRDQYLQAWWNVVNWDKIGERYEQATG